MFEIPTAAAVDSTLATLDDQALIKIVEEAGQLPMVEWARMTAGQRRAMRASNMLTKRATAAERQAAEQAARAAGRVEAKLQLQIAGRADRERRDLEPLLEKKRKELQYR